MKKILLTAVGLTALSGAATADSNYVGLGVGWNIAQTKDKGSVERENEVKGFKRTLKENGAPSGILFLGRSFGSFFVEAHAGLDTTKAQEKHLVQYVKDPDYGKARFSATLKRKIMAGFGVGANVPLSQDWSATVKASALWGQFELSHKEHYVKGSGVDAENEDSGSFKKKSKFGFGVEVGVSKDLTSDMSLGLSYQFSRYQKIKTSVEEKDDGGVPGHARYDVKVNPAYHTVMLKLSHKF